MKKILKSVLVLVCMCAVPLSSYAATAQSFNFSLSNIGSVAYNSITKTLVGNNIGVNGLQVNYDDGTSHIYEITNGDLDFYTAANAGGSWEWGNGGSISLSGSIADLSISFSTLMSGSFFEVISGTPAVSIQKPFSMPGANYYNVFANLSGVTVDSQIGSLFGVDSNYGGGLIAMFKLPSKTGVGSYFKDTVIAGGIIGAPPVPIPAAAWLFLSGFVGLAGLRRKNKK